MTRAGMCDFVAEQLDIPLDRASLLVDTLIPIEAYDRCDGTPELHPDDVNGWVDLIREDLDG